MELRSESGGGGDDEGDVRGSRGWLWWSVERVVDGGRALVFYKLHKLHQAEPRHVTGNLGQQEHDEKCMEGP